MVRNPKEFPFLLAAFGQRWYRWFQGVCVDVRKIHFCLARAVSMSPYGRCKCCLMVHSLYSEIMTDEDLNVNEETK